MNISATPVSIGPQLNIINFQFVTKLSTQIENLTSNLMFNFYEENVMNYNLALTKFFYLPFIIQFTRMHQFYGIWHVYE